MPLILYVGGEGRVGHSPFPFLPYPQLAHEKSDHPPPPPTIKVFPTCLGNHRTMSSSHITDPPP